VTGEASAHPAKVNSMFRLVLTLSIIVMLCGCGSGVHAVNYMISRSALSSKNISSLDYEDLRSGRLLEIRSRYEAVTLQHRSIEQQALLCDIYLKLQDFDQAQRCRGQLEADADRRNDVKWKTFSNGGRAIFALAQRRYQEAADRLKDTDGDGSRYLKALAHARLGDKDEANDTAAAFSRQFGPKPVYYAASLYAAMGNCPRALHLLEDPERRLLADYGLTTIGTSSTSRNQAPFRLDLFDEFSFGWFSDFSYAPAANIYVEVLAVQCMRSVGRTLDARARLEKLRNFAELASYRDIHWLVLYESGKVEKLLGNRTASLEYFRKAVEAVELGRSAIMTENGRIAFVSDKQEVYAEFVNDLLSNGDVSTAVEYVERSKARGLVDLLASRQVLAPADLPRDTAKRLLTDLSTAEGELVLVALRGEGNAGKAVASLKDTGSQIRLSASDMAPLITAVPRSMPELTSVLDRDEAAILYYESESRWLAFVVGNDGVNVVDLGVPGIRSLIEQFRREVLSFEDRSYLKTSQLLYDALLRPVLKVVRSRKLLIIPHGPLHYLPFAALHDGSASLIEQRSVRIAPSLSALVQGRQMHHSARNAGLIFGNPARGSSEYDLPSAGEEAAEIGRIFPMSTVYTGEGATIDRLRSEVRGKSFLHIAAHGLFYPDRPLESRLLFSTVGGGPADLTVGDFYEMRIDVPVAVLSACQTVMSNVAAGDDLIGLVRGLLFSGVNSVVGSYWDVSDDSTKLLMIEFYNALRSGMTVADALRRAQIATMKAYPHPFFWAAFAVMGEDRPL
jgi:CHAT domain-containing protein